MQLKGIFHILENLGSARIEGNHTTLADYVENHLDDTAPPSEQLDEIRNIEMAMKYIDKYLNEGDDISEHFIRELHALTVNGLNREGIKRLDNIVNIKCKLLNLNIFHLILCLYQLICKNLSPLSIKKTNQNMI